MSYTLPHSPKRTFYWALFSILTFLLYALFPMAYSTNDDVVMLLIASGKLGGSPDCHLVFSHFLYGKMLSGLYYLLPRFEWYTLFICFFNILSLSSLSGILFRLSPNSVFRIGLFFFLLSLFFYTNIDLQFTKTSTLLATTGLCVFLFGGNKTQGLVLFILAALVRFEATLMIFLLASPILFIEGWKGYIPIIRKQWKILVSVLIVIVVLKTIDRYYYSLDSQWKEYAQYNAVRGQVNDNPNLWDYMYDMPEGVSDEDFMLLSIATANTTAITHENLTKILAAINATPFEVKLSNIKFMDLYRKWIMLGIALSIIVFLNREKTARQILLYLLGMLLLFSVLSLNATIKARIFYPSFFLFYILSLCSMDFKKLDRQGLLQLSLLLLLVSAPSLRTIYKYGKLNAKRAQQFTSQKDMLDQYVSGGEKLIISGGSLKISKSDPFKISAQTPSNTYYFSGWLTKIPFNKDEFDSFENLINGHGILISKSNYDMLCDLIMRSIAHNYGIRVKPTILLEEPNSAIVKFNTL